MAIVNSCCCWLSLRVGSFICGFYTLIYYTIQVIAGFYNVETWHEPLSNDTLSMYRLGPYADDSYPLFIVAVTSCGITALSSIILLIGVFLENRLLLLPWLVSLIISTLTGFIFTVFVLGVAVIHPWFPFMATFDLFFCLLNVYCALCVVSLYQEYKSRRTRDGHDNLQYIKENSANSDKRSMTLTESDRASSRDPNSSQRRCSSPHPSQLSNSRKLSGCVYSKTVSETPTLTPKVKNIHANEIHSELQQLSNPHSYNTDITRNSTTSNAAVIGCNLDVKHLGNGNNQERRRSSSSATKHVQFHPTVDEANDVPNQQNDCHKHVEKNHKVEEKEKMPSQAKITTMQLKWYKVIKESLNDNLHFNSFLAD
ncbi:hypothetical protein CHUAL_012783 [Chamberlinius hualienensis]